MALDSTCGYAALSLMPERLTIEFKVNLLAPGKGERFRFRGSVTKPDRTIVVTDGQAYAFAGEDKPKLIATMTGTMIVRLGEPKAGAERGFRLGTEPFSAAEQEETRSGASSKLALCRFRSAQCACCELHAPP